MTAEAALLHRRVTLWLFEQLLRERIIPSAPVSPGDGVDATIRCEDGTYRDLIVAPSYDEHFPLAFRVAGLTPHQRLLVACVAWAVEPVQIWVFTAADFARCGSIADGATVLDLEAPAPEGGRLKQTLSRYRNAWRLITDGAVRAFVP